MKIITTLWVGMEWPSGLMALRNCVNNNALGGHLLLINHRFIREVAHHIIGLLLLSSVARVKSH